MRSSLHAGALILAGIAFGCGPAKTKAPVETTTAEGKATSPSGEAADRRGTTLVRVVNALPGRNTVDVAADQRVLFSKLGYRDVTEFQELRENVVRFSVRWSGQDSVLADNREVMGDGMRYTLVVIPDSAGPRLRVLQDELATDSSKTTLRVINAAAGTDKVSVVLQGREAPLFSNLTPATEAGYQELEPSTATLVFKAESGAPLARVDRIKLAAGRAHTVVLTGIRGGKLETVLFHDRLVRSGAQVSVKP